MPSSREGFGVAALEAQACGCVPICTDLPGVTDAIVQNGRTGFLIPPGQSDGFADAIATCAEERVGWKHMAASGHRAAASHFPLEQMGEAYHQLFTAGLRGQHRLPRPRSWQPGLDLEALPGSGFILEGIRRLARWWRSRSSA
jgi:glycosyltransferase involved in cell wall biosynthesis